MSDLENKIERTGAFELAADTKDAPLDEKDVKTLKVLVGQLDKITGSMKKLNEEAVVKSLDACIENIDTIKAEVVTQGFLLAMPDENYEKVVKSTIKDLPEDVSAKLLKLNKNQQIKVMSAAEENVSLFLNRKEHTKLEENLVNVYAKIVKNFPQIINRNQDNRAQEIMVEALQGGKLKNIEDAWKTKDLNKRLEAVKSTYQMLFKKEDKDYTFKLCAGNLGINGAYDHVSDFGVVSERLLSFPDWTMSMFTVIHENQHRLQHMQVVKLEKGLLKEDTAEYFQARVFKANFEGGYLSSSSKRTELEKTANYGDYVQQPVELNANNAGFVFTSTFSYSTVLQRKNSHAYGISESKRAKATLAEERAKDPEALSRKPTDQELKDAGLLTLIKNKKSR